MAARLRFLGAADSVTGSKFLIDTGDTRVLVDCGLFQGFKVLRERNRAPFPVPPESIDAVVLTHAHLDHSGYLPALVRNGFHGPVYTTGGTAELCGVILPDSGYLLEEEARHAASGRWSSHRDPTPLYTAADATRSLERFVPVDFDETRRIGRELVFTLVPAGHILGAAGVRVRVGGSVVHFTGDLGRPNDPLMHPPRPLESASVLVAESTYGDRLHPPADVEEELGSVVRRVAKRGGVVLIPAFAVGRTETVLLHLSRLRDRGEIPDLPIFLNSPMAVDAAAIYRRHPEEHRLDSDELARMYGLATPVHTVDDSKLLNLRGGPMIIVSASGMLTGGRILHHLVAYGPDRRNAIVLTGYQAGGTRGSTLLGGATSLRIFGEDVPIRAEVVSIDGMSAHADADELMAWMRTVDEPPDMVYVTHGEAVASDTLRARIKRELHWQVRVPEHLERVRIDAPERQEVAS
ncbi:MBL fold metallo-hydrolase RNA specificity domain-containing protein [Agromyces bauzanensis]|uniref:MBL fold hydrolase n=1 Tax=Agromyces bauzanensis TaxID=1308924 RepID=A0A917PIZ6_9MICO|nr:MBL fold metallo-hydrolase [Agromyces bauzanensis]GGJ80337.1 MBL fold hydrolase [Agromyces bauzanensis]